LPPRALEVRCPTLPTCIFAQQKHIHDMLNTVYTLYRSWVMFLLHPLQRLYQKIC
jgi:hypothetical protein